MGRITDLEAVLLRISEKLLWRGCHAGHFEEEFPGGGVAESDWEIAIGVSQREVEGFHLEEILKRGLKAIFVLATEEGDFGGEEVFEVAVFLRQPRDFGEGNDDAIILCIITDADLGKLRTLGPEGSVDDPA